MERSIAVWTRRRPSWRPTRGDRPRRHPASRVRGGRSSRSPIGRGRQLHLGLDLSRVRPFAASGNDAAGVIDVVRDAYATVTRALRLPLHGGFEAMAAVTSDIPFIARRSTRDAAETRERLASPAIGRSSSRHSAARIRLAVRRARRRRTPHRPRAGARSAASGPTYPDLVAAADVVRQQTRLRHRLGVRGQRDAAALHLTRTISSNTTCSSRRCRACCAAAILAAMDFLRGPLGRRGPRAARAAAAAGTRAD